ncbi:MAG: 7-carboxy-7-deazaguanine synthase [Deltaproteobacteria bacterium RBG_13_43_22]|nr:MAG: 7-carboxy-7-deazaguanine synthase [Deltaproteobacteria bacterium RBG_13_43_22]
MSYSIKEIYYTLQGEGAQVGRPAVFCRFSGCNLWSGREEDRPQSRCRFCDTDFLGTNGPGGGNFQNPKDLAEAVRAKFPATGLKPRRPLVVCTGGEPLLQMDEPLVSAFHHLGFEVAVETNGTLLPPSGIDWICVSPKAGVEIKLRSGDELKLVFPQEGLEPENFTSLEFHDFFLQPKDGPGLEQNIQETIRYCLEHPRWRLSLQMHKIAGIR